MGLRESRSALPLLAVALAAAGGVLVGLLAGRLLLAGRTQSPASAPAVQEQSQTPRTAPLPAGGADPRVDALEARIDALGRELEDLRSSRRDAVTPEPTSPLPTDEVFVERYRDAVVDIIDRDRLEREVARRTDALCAIIKNRAEQDPEVERNSSALKDLAREYMQRQKEIVVALTRHGAWPSDADPEYAEWVNRWRDLRAWLNANLYQTLSAAGADALSELITQNSYITEW